MLDDPADRVPQISTDALHFSESPHIASLLPELERVPKANARLTRGLLWWKAASPIGRCPQLDVQAHFLIEIVHAAPARDEEPQTAKPGHAICSTRAIALVTRW